MTEITPLLLAGGSGSRLWPLSRGSYPKQFAPLIDNITLFQQGAKRLIGTNTINFSKMITITNSDFTSSNFGWFGSEISNDMIEDLILHINTFQYDEMKEIKTKKKLKTKIFKGKFFLKIY